MLIYLPLAVSVIGLIIWGMANPGKVQDAGKYSFVVGLFVFLLKYSGGY